MTAYMTSVSARALEAGAAHLHAIGLLVQPGNTLSAKVGKFPFWAADNGAFTKVSTFSPTRFMAMLRRDALVEHISTCRFVVAPDVLRVMPSGKILADAKATLQQYPAWAKRIEAAGFPVALVAQDGLENMLDVVPWDHIDCLFVGGSTEWKLGRGARRCVEMARARGKTTHMGRVNSYRRLRVASSWGIDTADGTFLSYAPDMNLTRLLGWLRKVNRDTQQTSLKGIV